MPIGLDETQEPFVREMWNVACATDLSYLTVLAIQAARAGSTLE